MPAPRDFAPHTRERFRALGLEFATELDIVEGHALAARTVGDRVATVETLLRIQAHTECASYVVRGPDGNLAGALSIIPLTLAAGPGLALGAFDGLTPPEAHAARPGDPVIALYGWGMAGVTWRGRATVMAAAVALHREIHPDLPLYGRAATPGGERTLLKRIGAHPVPGPGGLVMAPAWLNARKAA